MPDRTVAPEINNIDYINYQIPEIYTLDNGIKVYSFYSDNSPIIKMDMIFNAGIEYQKDKLVSIFSNSLLKEAPIGMHPDEVAELFDYYGSVIENFTGTKTAGSRLYVTTQFAKDILPIYAKLITDPSIPDNEFEILKSKQYETLKNNLKKTKYLSIRGLNSDLFGSKNPRGYVITPEDILNVNINNIKNFVFEHYHSNNCYIIISGMINDSILKLCNDYFGKNNNTHNWNRKDVVKNVNNPINESSEYFRFINVENSVQSTICIGKNLGKLDDKELIDIGILNTILGGYFGSRLMKNIREDKGYTYGIGSFIVEYPDISCLKITSDVGSNVTKSAIDEIFKEMEILCNNIISEQELNLVKNYMLGELISAFDGVLNTSEIWERLISNGKDKSYIDLNIERVKNITSDEIRELARKFLSNNGFHTVVAGAPIS